MFQKHEERCPNRILFDTAIFESEDMKRPVPVVSDEPIIEYDESWDGVSIFYICSVQQENPL